MVARYYIENATLEPTLALSLTDNWIALNLRYIADYKLRGATKHQLFHPIKQALPKTNGSFTLAYAALQLLKIPELEVNIKK